MTFRAVVLTVSFFLTFTLIALTGADDSILRLRSGRELPLSDGQLRFKDAQALVPEAEAFLSQGRFDLVRDNCQAIRTKGDASLLPQVTSLMRRAEEIENSSFVILNNGQGFQGKLHLKLRKDHLGIGKRQEISLWELRRIEAKYFIDYSLVTKTFYIKTVLQVQFRDAPEVKINLTDEIPIVVEGENGSVQRAIIGYPYVLLRKEEMGNVFPEVIQDRIAKIVVYPALYEDDLSSPESPR